MIGTDPFQRQSKAFRGVLLTAQFLALGALLLGLLVLFHTTGGSVFMFTTVAPVLTLGGGCLFFAVVITTYRRRHNTLREMLSQIEVLMHVSSPIHTDRPLSERLDTLATLARASLGANAVTIVVLRGQTPLIVSGEPMITGEPAAEFALRVKDTEGPAVFDRSQIAALLGLSHPPATCVAAASLRLNGDLGVMLAEFQPELLTRENSDLLLDMLRIFAENAVIAIDNATVLQAGNFGGNSLE